jgi:hypothetical protein
MKYKILFLIFLTSCVQSNSQVDRQGYSAKGFAYIYNDSAYECIDFAVFYNRSDYPK